MRSTKYILSAGHPRTYRVKDSIHLLYSTRIANCGNVVKKHRFPVSGYRILGSASLPNHL